jgi:hypothetical protein
MTMIRPWRTLALAVLGLSALEFQSAHAQIKVQGAKKIVIKPGTVVERQTYVIPRRRPWRERNPYFVARPTYTPAYPGERAKITFAPFTSLYYPKEDSYYPPLNAPTAIDPR